MVLAGLLDYGIIFLIVALVAYVSAFVACILGSRRVAGIALVVSKFLLVMFAVNFAVTLAIVLGWQ